jgi:hypothetical protein
MKKVAKLVYVTLLTRVIVNEDASEQEIMELAIPKLSENLMDSPYESIDKIVDDNECPYDEDEIISEFLQQFCTKVEPNEKSSFVELMMDDHDCIKYNGIEYYVPQNCMLWGDEENEIHDKLIEKYLVE